MEQLPPPPTPPFLIPRIQFLPIQHGCCEQRQFSCCGQGTSFSYSVPPLPGRILIGWRTSGNSLGYSLQSIRLLTSFFLLGWGSEWLRMLCPSWGGDWRMFSVLGVGLLSELCDIAHPHEWTWIEHGTTSLSSDDASRTVYLPTLTPSPNVFSWLLL